MRRRYEVVSLRELNDKFIVLRWRTALSEERIHSE